MIRGWLARLPISLSVAALLLAVAPFFALAQFAHASSDDFCAANQMRELGFWESQKEWYLRWTGRYTAALMLNVGPLSFGELGMYKIVAVALVVLLWAALLWVSVEMLRGQVEGRWILLISITTFAVYVSAMASPAEGFYWYTGAIIFTWGAILAISAISAGLRAERAASSVAAWTWTSVATALAVAAAGSNEIVLLFLALVFTAMTALSMRAQERRRFCWLVPLTFTIVGGAVAVVAPGNFRRAEATGGVGGGIADVVGAVFGSAAFSGAAIIEWLSNGPVIMALLVLLAAGSAASARLPANSRWRDVPWWILGLATLAAVWGAFLFTHWASGFVFRPGPPDRVTNIVLLLFLILSALTVFMIGVQSLRRFSDVAANLRPALPWAVLALSAMLYGRGNVREAYTDLVTGRAATYDREQVARYAMVRSARERADSVTVPPLTRTPKTIAFRDITTDSGDWRNRCFAEYWGVPAVRLRQNESSE